MNRQSSPDRARADSGALTVPVPAEGGKEQPTVEGVSWLRESRSGKAHLEPFALVEDADDGSAGLGDAEGNAFAALAVVEQQGGVPFVFEAEGEAAGFLVGVVGELEDGPAILGDVEGEAAFAGGVEEGQVGFGRVGGEDDPILARVVDDPDLLGDQFILCAEVGSGKRRCRFMPGGGQGRQTLVLGSCRSRRSRRAPISVPNSRRPWTWRKFCQTDDGNNTRCQRTTLTLTIAVGAGAGATVGCSRCGTSKGGCSRFEPPRSSRQRGRMYEWRGGPGPRSRRSWTVERFGQVQRSGRIVASDTRRISGRSDGGPGDVSAAMCSK